MGLLEKPCLTTSVYIMKLSGDNHGLQKSLGEYTEHNANIHSLCYVPVHLDLVCRIMKEWTRNNEA